MEQLTYTQASTSTTDDLQRSLDCGRDGLTTAEADARRGRVGDNTVLLHTVTAREILLRQLRSPFIYLLAAAMVVALIAGERLDAVMILVFVFINTSLGFYQEYRAEQAARLLLRFWRDEATVVRDGTTQVVDASELVPGDLVRLAPGDRVPADVRLLDAFGMIVDESVLTGESAPAAKDAAAMSAAPADHMAARNILFAGTTVKAGEGKGLVIATGRASSLGTIVRLTAGGSPVGAFERGIADFSRFILKVVSVTLVMVVVLNGVTHGWDQLDHLVLFAIALAIGVVPEALPVVMTVVHSSAALRLAKKDVIVKRLSAVDDLGGIEVLCTDKTGTLTENMMRVAEVIGDDRAQVMRLALLGAGFDGSQQDSSNPFDAALWRAADTDAREAVAPFDILAELPFEPVRRINSMLVVDAKGARSLIVRGSPEEVLDRCASLEDPVALGRVMEQQGHEGRRVLAVAWKPMPSGASTVTAQDERGLTYAGMIAFEDPLKDDAIAAVRKAESLGVQVKMLTGDAREVAGAVAIKLGLVNEFGAVMTGAEFDALPPPAQLEAALATHVFARVSPEQKYRILGLLRQHGKSTAFLGEGFNDAPALTTADVGIAVDNASDVAKDAADVILTRRSLAAIVDGIELGRVNFANIITYLKITLASNFGNFYAVAIASLFIPFLPMLPVQILLLNLVTDAPMIAISRDTVARSQLLRPAHYDVKGLVFAATILGVVSSSFDFLTFFLFRGLGESGLQTLWFMESALTEIALIFSVRTMGPFYKGARVPIPIAAIAVAVASFTLLAPYTRPGQDLLGFTPPTVAQLATVVGIVAAYFVVSEAVKLATRKGLEGIAAIRA